MEIVKVELNLKQVNKNIRLFNCNKKVSGVIHILEDGDSTVILDGGYVLGNFDCPICAVEAIALLAAKIGDGEMSGHGSYRQHKRTFMKRAFITVH
ncbi:DNA breaking-rejoining protein [Enterobacter hormaechei]|uniref:DNA breaking-rejoining protein n=1 Tax=Enterobacter hormaechei TaxID=158836 RepID=UPI0012B8C62B|nr:DNA breaking-rejoining protein [Enterobacter hormaechei]